MSRRKRERAEQPVAARPGGRRSAAKLQALAERRKSSFNHCGGNSLGFPDKLFNSGESIARPREKTHERVSACGRSAPRPGGIGYFGAARPAYLCHFAAAHFGVGPVAACAGLGASAARALCAFERDEAAGVARRVQQSLERERGAAAESPGSRSDRAGRRLRGLRSSGQLPVDRLPARLWATVSTLPVCRC